MKNPETKERKQRLKSFEAYYDELSKCVVLKVLDPEMYPFLLEDPEAGIRTIRKTRDGKLLMN